MGTLSCHGLAELAFLDAQNMYPGELRLSAASPAGTRPEMGDLRGSGGIQPELFPLSF